METGIHASGHDSLAERVERRISSLLQIRTRIHFVPPGTFPQEANKSRFIAEDLSAIIDSGISPQGEGRFGHGRHEK